MAGLKVSDSEVCPRTFLLPVLPALFFPPCNGRVGVLILRPCFRVTLPHKRLETVDSDLIYSDAQVTRLIRALLRSFCGRPIRIVRFQKRFLKGCHLRHCRGVNLNFCLILKTRAIALVLKKREVLLYTGAFKPRKSVSDSTSECQKYTPKFT